MNNSLKYFLALIIAILLIIAIIGVAIGFTYLGLMLGGQSFIFGVCVGAILVFAGYYFKHGKMID